MISGLFDWIEKMVSPAKSLHEAIYKEEDIYTYIQEEQPVASVHLASQQYAQAVAQSNVYQSVQMSTGSGLGNLVGASTPYYTVTGTGIGSPVSNTPVYAAQYLPPIQMPSPSGIMMHALFVDAQGQRIALVIDQVYATYLQQISQMHQYNMQMYGVKTATPPPPTHKMVDGDFSFEEMETAEDIIKELGQGHEACFEAQGSSPD